MSLVTSTSSSIQTTSVATSSSVNSPPTFSSTSSARDTGVISCYYHNASSIRGKAKNFRMGILDNNYDIIIIGETWLTLRMNSAEYFPSNYMVYRKDRYDYDTDLKGGGILIAVKSNFPSELIARHPNISLIAVRIIVSSIFVFVIAVYVPHGSSIDYYHMIIEFIKSDIMPLVRDSDHLMIIGDFNLPGILWFDINGVFSSSTTDEKATILLDYCATISATQVNRIFNSGGKLLDLLFTNDVLFSKVLSCEDFTGCTSIYHSPITINIFFPINCDLNQFSNNFFFDFRKADYTSLNTFLDSADWDFIQHMENLNDSVKTFNALLKAGVQKYVPLVRTTTHFREPWYNRKLIAIEKRRNKLHSLFRLHGAEFYTDFSHARKEFKTLNWFLYNNYMLQIEDDLSANPKAFWKFINNKRKTSGFPSSMKYQNSIANFPSDICDLFADFFASVYEPASSSCVTFRNSVNSFNYSFNFIKFTVDEVRDRLLNLDINKGPGHDGIPPILFKNCAESLAPYVTLLFNESLRSGVFPDPWKISIICPIFKSGRRDDVANYRGIALLSVIPKLFESMVHNVVSFHIRPIISPAQHGFFPGRSTVTNLVAFCGDLFSSYNSKHQLDVIYTDFAKAFDKIDHAILIDKLERLQCRYLPVRWLISYLSDRWQFVKISDCFSRYFRATSGVPQGSHIGPLLFLIFINDVVECFKFAKCLLFADDMKIFAPTTNLSDCLLLQSELFRFCTWCTSNKLALNVNKCMILSYFRIRSPIVFHYSLQDVVINRIEYCSDLGVVFSSDLTFTKHIDFVINRANTMLGFIKRNCADFCDPLTLKALYVAFVRSILEYASPVWSPLYMCHSERIESVQRQFVLYALRHLPHNRSNAFVLPPYQDRCGLLGLQRLDHRRKVASVIFIFDILNARIDCAQLLARFFFYAPARRVRRREGFLHIATVSTNHGLLEPALRMSRLFNLFYHMCDFHISRDVFRKVLYKNLSG